MERLTERIDGWIIRKGCHGPCRTCNGAGCADIYLMVDRLAAYEDTGLTPEEVVQTQLALIGKALAEIKEIEGITADRMIELAQAEKDGRLVVLPCKKGDTLWSYYNYPASCICKLVVTSVSTIDGMTVINTDNYGVIPEKDIGKSIFLTREEAEAALKKREETS